MIGAPEVGALVWRAMQAVTDPANGRHNQNLQKEERPMTSPEQDLQRPDTIRRFFAAIQAGDYPVLQEVLIPDAVTRWPQSGERMTSAMACVRVYENYPGGPPAYVVQRISGGGDTWVAELTADYPDGRWYNVSVVEFDGARIARMTDYFGPTFPAPEWRQAWVERE
jgi:hypothetical protein